MLNLRVLNSVREIDRATGTETVRNVDQDKDGETAFFHWRFLKEKYMQLGWKLPYHPESLKQYPQKSPEREDAIRVIRTLVLAGLRKPEYAAMREACDESEIAAARAGLSRAEHEADRKMEEISRDDLTDHVGRYNRLVDRFNAYAQKVLTVSALAPGDIDVLREQYRNTRHFPQAAVLPLIVAGFMFPRIAQGLVDRLDNREFDRSSQGQKCAALLSFGAKNAEMDLQLAWSIACAAPEAVYTGRVPQAVTEAGFRSVPPPPDQIPDTLCALEQAVEDRHAAIDQAVAQVFVTVGVPPHYVL